MTAPARTAPARPAGPAPAPATVVAAPPPVTVKRPGPFRRLAALRRTTPGRLRLRLTALVTVALLTGLVAGITAASAGSGTDDLGDRAQPLLVEAETVWTALADADTTATQAFLAGGLEPADLTQRYEADLDRAAQAIASASRLSPETSEAGQAVRELSIGLPQYTALVASARANNRQGLPLGASYLSSASELNRVTLQPRAEALLHAAQVEVDGSYSSARSSLWSALLTVLLIVLLAMLLITQVQLSARTRRTFNVPLAAATVVTALLGITTLTILTIQRDHLHNADEGGSRPVALLAQARILVLNERSYEALTLVGRAGDDDNETQFKDTVQKLAGVLDETERSVQGTRAEESLESAQEYHQEYLAAHKEVRALDDQADYAGAVKLAIGTETTRTFQRLSDSLSKALDDRKDVFTHESSVAGRGLGLLTVLGPALALAVAALAVAGLRARLEEYR
ncbi:hypothetical protein [Winogradskya consettensis]|uniref:hypothetical protein n=1 Tax=Winogradskya consettensis TaxID=113560 RepID=UPI001FD26680|nr:hypothetical protein [Actinoplanes consettensis]